MKNFWTWLNANSGAVTTILGLASLLVVIGVYKATVDNLERRITALESKPRVMVQASDPRKEECARIAKEAFGDGTRTQMDDRSDLILLRLGCDK